MLLISISDLASELVELIIGQLTTIEKAKFILVSRYIYWHMDRYEEEFVRLRYVISDERATVYRLRYDMDTTYNETSKAHICNLVSMEISNDKYDKYKKIKEY